MKYGQSAGPVFPLRDAAGGANHSIIIDGAGEVWACGSDEKGQCGITGVDSRSVRRTEYPELTWGSLLHDMKDLGKIDFMRCWCGWDTTVILDSSGALWCFGDNSFGQCGMGSENLKTVQPSLDSRLNLGSAELLQVSCGTRHCVAVTVSGEVYGWGGVNKYGELPGSRPTSCPPRRNVEVPPTKLRVPPAIGAACGLNYTAILTKTGEIILYGRSRYIDSGVQTLEAGAGACNLLCIYSLWNTVIALDRLSVIHGLGRNDYGQLCFLKDQKHECNAGNNLAVSSIAAGSEHCLALLSCKCVVAWGWNEHGNCGAAAGSAVSHMHVVHGGGAASMVACGAGHSIIATKCTKTKAL